MNDDAWRIRRRFMFLVSGFCAVVITYILLRDIDTEAAQTAVSMSFVTLMGTVSSYVFGAAWDDIHKRKGR